MEGSISSKEEGAGGNVCPDVNGMGYYFCLRSQGRLFP